MSKVTGIMNAAQLEAQFKEWIEKEAKTKVHDSIVEAVEVQTEKVLQTAQSLVPVKSGKLKNAIKKKISAGGHYGTVYVDADDAYWAHMVHFGTTKQPAQPFLYQASDQHASELAQRIENNIKNKSND